MSKKHIRVVIAGASVTGLTLANMLESAGIDYVLLEAGDQIAPQVGASIALAPPALRILDQLGLYEKIKDLFIEPVTKHTIRGPSGEVWFTDYAHTIHMEKRHGYPLMFVERRSLLQVLFDNIKNKTKVLTDHRVEQILSTSNPVRVKVKSGVIITGDVLVGADGVHSTVRREMWRQAEKLAPGYFPKDEASKVDYSNAVVFGISKPLPGEPEMGVVTGKGYSYIVARGAGFSHFWFLFAKMTKTKSGDRVPRYSKEENMALIDNHRHDRLLGKWKLNDLYESSLVSGATTVLMHIYERWHFQRVITIGDSAHSQHPISGQGGMSCIESSATLVNALVKQLKRTPEGPSDDDINKMFARVQASRMERLQVLLDFSKNMIKDVQLERPLSFLTPVLLAISSPEANLITRSLMWTGGERLNHVAMPKRPRMVPYDDELPAKPMGETSWHKVITAVALCFSFLVAHRALRIPSNDGFVTYGGDPLVAKYTGISFIDKLFSILTSFFSFSLTSSDLATHLQLIELLIILLPVYSIWTAESYRVGNRFTIIALPILFTWTSQLYGMGWISHIYFLFAVFSGTNRIAEKRVSVYDSKAILPAVCIGYILPTILMLLPFGNLTTRNYLGAIWQIAPLFCAALTIIISKCLHLLDTEPLAGRTYTEGHIDTISRWYNKKDINALKLMYAFVFASSAIVHVTVVLYTWIESGLSLWSWFTDLPNPFASEWGVLDPAETTYVFFRYDILFSSFPILIFLLHTTYDMRRLGYITTATAKRAVLAIFIGQVTVGPAATYAATWYWRETVWAELSY